MAGSIAKAVLGSKVKEMTKGLGDAVGLDDDNNEGATLAEAKHTVNQELKVKKERREKDKKELHSYKAAERQDIRSKYQLKDGRTASSSKSTPKSPSKTTSKSSDEKNCSIS